MTKSSIPRKPHEERNWRRQLRDVRNDVWEKIYGHVGLLHLLRIMCNANAFEARKTTPENSQKQNATNFDLKIFSAEKPKTKTTESRLSQGIFSRLHFTSHCGGAYVTILSKWHKLKIEFIRKVGHSPHTHRKTRRERERKREMLVHADNGLLSHIVKSEPKMKMKSHTHRHTNNFLLDFLVLNISLCLLVWCLSYVGFPTFSCHFELWQ